MEQARARGRDPTRRDALREPAGDGGRPATLGLLDGARTSALGRHRARLAAPASRALAAAAGVSAQVRHVCGLLTVFFAAGAGRDYAGARAGDPSRFCPFPHAAMLERGIYLPPSPFEASVPRSRTVRPGSSWLLEAAGAAFKEIFETAAG